MCSDESDVIISLDDGEPVESVSSLFAKWQDSEASLYKIVSETPSWEAAQSDDHGAEQEKLQMELASLVSALLDTPSRTTKESLMKLRVWVRSVAPRDHLIGLCSPPEQLAISAVQELESELLLMTAQADSGQDQKEP